MGAGKGVVEGEKVCVVDAPLLIEAGLWKMCGSIVVVYWCVFTFPVFSRLLPLFPHSGENRDLRSRGIRLTMILPQLRNPPTTTPPRTQQPLPRRRPSPPFLPNPPLLQTRLRRLRNRQLRSHQRPHRPSRERRLETAEEGRVELVVELAVSADWDTEGVVEGRVEAVCEGRREGEEADHERGGEEEARGDRAEGEGGAAGLGLLRGRGGLNFRHFPS